MDLIGVLSNGGQLYGTLDGPLVRGYSAYEIAKEHGYTGTEEQWLASIAAASPTAQSNTEAAEQAAQSAAAATEAAEQAAQSAAAATEAAEQAAQSAAAATEAAEQAAQSAAAAASTSTAPDAQNGGSEDAAITTTVDEHVSQKYIGADSNVSGGTVLEEIGYIDIAGVFQASDGWRSSDYIEAGSALSITLSLYGFSAVCACAFYDDSKAFISGVSGSDWTALSGVQSTPAGTRYYRLCIRDVDNTGYIVCEDVRTTTVTVPAAQKIMVGEITGGDAGYIDSTGALQASASWVATAPIRCGDVDSLTTSALAFASVPYAVFFDKYGVVSGALSVTQNGQITANITIPNGAHTVRLNYYAEDTTQYYQIARDLERTAAIEALQMADPLYGKKIGCAGDSITIGTWSAPGMTYPHQIANAHNMSIDNRAIWGSVFPPNKVDGQGATRGSIYAQLAEISADCDIIIISGGINDADYFEDEMYWGEISDGYDAALDTSTFCGAFEATLKYALNKWKGRPILFVFEHRMTQIYQSSYGAHFEEYQHPLMLKMLGKWGIPYVDLFHDMPSIKFTPGYIDLYSFDDVGVHPNVDGYRKFYTPRVELKLMSIAT